MEAKQICKDILSLKTQNTTYYKQHLLLHNVTFTLFLNLYDSYDNTKNKTSMNLNLRTGCTNLMSRNRMKCMKSFKI